MTAEERKLKKHLQELVKAVEVHLDKLDKVMKQPSTPERGKQVAGLCNVLERAKDNARFFGLDIDFRTGKPRVKDAKQANATGAEG